MFGSNAKWWLPRDIESISCVGTCKNDKCKKKFKKGKWKCFSKGNKIQIIVNWTALHTRKALRNFSSKAPQQTSSWLRFCSFIYGLVTQEHSEKPDFLQSRLGSSWAPTNNLCEGVVQDSHISHSLLLQESKRPYQHFCLAQVKRLLCCVSLHSQGEGGRGCMWFQWNNGIDLWTSRKWCTSPGWLQEVLYLLKILLGLWAVGENFQIATAYTRSCPPIPCLLCCLSHIPSLLLVLSEQCSPGIQNKSNAWPPAFPARNSRDRQDVIIVTWAFISWIPFLPHNHLHIWLPTSP